MSTRASSTTPAPISVPIDRLSLTLSLVVVGLTISLLLNLPFRVLDFSFLGSRATFLFSGAWLFAIILVALTATGVDSIHRAHPRVRLSPTRYVAILWILPCVLVGMAALVIPSFAGARPLGLIAILVTITALNLIILAEYRTIDVSDRAYPVARLGLNLAAFAIAFMLFTAVYSFKLRSVLSSPVISLTSGLIALELLRGSESDVRRTWLYGTAVGLAMGEVIWAINYWNIGALQAGVLLTVIFYVLTSIAQQYLWGYLSRWMAVEFGVVILAILVLMSRFGHL